jgi:hypothetical protein
MGLLANAAVRAQKAQALTMQAQEGVGARTCTERNVLEGLRGITATGQGAVVEAGAVRSLAA